MMRNRGARVPAMNTGSGLLGARPAVSAGMKRMMAGVGGGLLGSGPKKQPRSLLSAQGLGVGSRDHQSLPGGMLDAPEYGERQSYSEQTYGQAARIEQTDPGYYDERGAGFREEQPTYHEYGHQNEGIYDRDLHGQEQYDNQDYGYSQRIAGGYHEASSSQRGLLDEQTPRRGVIGQPRSLLEEPAARNRQVERYDGRGLLENPAETRSLLGAPADQRGLQQPRDQPGRMKMQFDHHHGLLDTQREQLVHSTVRSQPGILGSPRERGFPDQAGHQRDMDMEMEQLGFHDHTRDQRGLMEPPLRNDLAEPPRPPRALMDINQEPRSLMNTPVEPRSLLDMNQRGLMDRPREERRQMDQRGLPDRQVESLAKVPSPRHKDKNQQGRKHSDLMEKADLQMKLLQQQEKMREMELLKQQQQQVILLQHQQQHLQQLQQQQQMQEQLQIKQQMQQAEIMMKAGKNLPRTGGIPSLLDVPTVGQSTLGKRPSVAARRADNKRPRTGPAIRGDRRPLPRDRKDITRNRLADRRQDRNRRGRNHSRQDSPDRKKRDRKDSDSRSKTTTPSKDRIDRSRERHEKGKEREKDKDVKSKADAPESEQYDPAEPTEDVVVKVEIEGEKSEPQEKMEVKESEEKTDVKETKADLKKDEQKDEKKDEDKDDKKHQEISLTVTVNKKGRSVNDADTKDVKKRNQTKMYKCNVCTVECYDEESFARHMNGKKHSEKMKIVMSSTSQQAILIKSRLQAEEHLRQIEGTKRTHGPTGSAGPKGKPLETHCKVCDKKFTGAYKDHKETGDHKAREDRSKAGCKICKVTTFSTYQDYVKHLQSNWHLKNKKKSSNEEEEEEIGDLVTLDTVGYEEDTNVDQERKEMDTDSSVFVKPIPADKEHVTSTPKATAKPMKVDSVTPVKPEEEEVVVPETYDPGLPVGQKYVVAVSGFFCKLCHKFYNNETAAKVTHCQSQAHFQKLKQILDAKRAKAEEMSKKKEVTQSGTQSEDQNKETSQEKTVENGNQSNGETTVEEPSQYETADEQDNTANSESQDSQDVSESNDTVEERESTATDLAESQEGKEETAEKPSEVKQQRARRGGGVARTRRGRR